MGIKKEIEDKLHYYNNLGFSDKEIAEKMNLKLNSVRNFKYAAGIRKGISWDKDTLEYTFSKMEKYSKNRDLYCFENVFGITFKTIKNKIIDAFENGILREEEYKKYMDIVKKGSAINRVSKARFNV